MSVELTAAPVETSEETYLQHSWVQAVEILQTANLHAIACHAEKHICHNCYNIESCSEQIGVEGIKLILNI